MVRKLGTKRTFIEPNADFFFDVITGNVPGLTRFVSAGNNDGLASNVEESVNNISLEDGVGAIYTYVSADTTVYVSSSDGSDTQTYALLGLNDAYTPVLRIATANGQTPVVFSGDIFRIDAVINISSPAKIAVGNVYISTDNTDITAGVPNTLSKVLGKVDVGRTDGPLPNRTVPAGKMGFFYDFVFNSSKATDAEIFLRFRLDKDADFSTAPPFLVFQNTALINSPTLLPAQSEIDATALTPTAGSKATVSFQVIFIDV